jgi:hypothetical protein
MTAGMDAMGPDTAGGPAAVTSGVVTRTRL